MEKKKKHIYVIGNIGVGKTTLINAVQTKIPDIRISKRSFENKFMDEYYRLYNLFI